MSFLLWNSKLDILLDNSNIYFPFTFPFYYPEYHLLSLNGQKNTDLERKGKERKPYHLINRPGIYPTLKLGSDILTVFSDLPHEQHEAAACSFSADRNSSKQKTFLIAFLTTLLRDALFAVIVFVLYGSSKNIGYLGGKLTEWRNGWG